MDKNAQLIQAQRKIRRAERDIRSALQLLAAIKEEFFDDKEDEDNADTEKRS